MAKNVLHCIEEERIFLHLLHEVALLDIHVLDKFAVDRRYTFDWPIKAPHLFRHLFVNLDDKVQVDLIVALVVDHVSCR